MLSPADDYLIHQTPETFDRVFTSDRNFYDRYYWNLNPCSDELFLVTGMGQYPNLGTTDAFVSISHGDTMYVVRASRELGSDRLNSVVGPFGVEVIEGLRRFRVWLEPNEWGVSFDLTWEGATPSVEEPPFFTRQFNRIISQGSRLMQTGYWSGTLEVAGRKYDVTPDRWWGSRDHSWGVRPVGEPEAMGIRAKTQAASGFLHLWAPMQFKDSTIKVYLDEDGDGNVTHLESVRAYAYGSGKDVEPMGTPRHELKYLSGTREIASGKFIFSNPGKPDREVSFTPLRTVYLSAGTGYGRDPDWVHGMYQGELKVQGLKYDVSTQAARTQVAGLNETLSRYEFEGEVGYGLFENVNRGIYKPYGFLTPEAVAP